MVDENPKCEEFPDDMDFDSPSFTFGNRMAYNVEFHDDGRVSYLLREDADTVERDDVVPFCHFCTQDQQDTFFAQWMVGTVSPCEHLIGRMGEYNDEMPDMGSEYSAVELLEEVKTRCGQVQSASCRMGATWGSVWETFWYAQDVHVALKAAQAIADEWSNNQRA